MYLYVNPRLTFWVHRDCFVSLWWPHAGSCVSFTVELALHKEVAFLFQVEVAVRAHKAFWMPVLITCLHHCPSVWEQQKEKAPMNLCEFKMRGETAVTQSVRRCSGPWQGDWNHTTFNIPPNSNHSMILR